MTVQDPVKKLQPDGMSHRGQESLGVIHPPPAFSGPRRLPRITGVHLRTGDRVIFSCNDERNKIESLFGNAVKDSRVVVFCFTSKFLLDS